MKVRSLNHRFCVVGVRLSGILLFFLLCGGTEATVAQDLSQIAGDLTVESHVLPPQQAVTLPAPNIASRDRFEYHLTGFVSFNRSFLFEENGLGERIIGPDFNHTSCNGCHFNDGKGRIGFPARQDSEGSPMILKVSLPGLNPDGSPRDVPGIGEQLHDHSTQGKAKATIRLKWRNVRGRYGDGTKYTLRKPALSYTLHTKSKARRKYITSLRMTPPTIGMGLLEGIPDAVIQGLADPLDRNGDGISGRVSTVPDRENGGYRLGRFGFKASHPTLLQQTAAALFHDMGLTNKLFSDATGSEEVSADELDRLVFYMQAAGFPAARSQNDPDVIAGKRIFADIGCADCHVPTFQTLETGIPETSEQQFHPFTDLLLHDMGRGLADKRREFSALGSEWRTAPLWGLGLTRVLNQNAPGFLHDGRARTLSEAILWHGGEGAASQRRFKSLSSSERDQLIKFLESL